MKKTLKFIAIPIIVLCASTAVSYSAFRYFLNEDSGESHYVHMSEQDKSTALAASSSALPVEGSADEPLEFDFYIARLEGNVINIYVSDEGRESFLYSIDVYVKNIPYDDVKILSEGVKLYSKQELTSFEEDFTS